MLKMKNYPKKLIILIFGFPENNKLNI